MTLDELKAKASTLPYAPGVYIMQDKTGQVIYVGKAKKLRNRVSQYFQDTSSHSLKTKTMVSKIHHFDVIVAASEFEALVLECSLIKQHMPKYNILLKDDKGYPYVRLDKNAEYPTLTMVSKIGADKALYFGPFGSRSITQSLLEAIRQTLRLPQCSREFPRDIGKDRPCLHFHMGQCAGWCRGNLTAEQFRQTMEQARQLLGGNYRQVTQDLREQMESAASQLNFELAASLRDKLLAVETLSQKQLVTALTPADTDVIGYAATDSKACLAILHFSKGNLTDKEYEIFAPADEPQEAVSSLLKQYYLARGFAPKVILLPFDIADGNLISQLLEQQYGHKVYLRTPQRGDNAHLVDMANKNALDEAQRCTSKEEQLSGLLILLGKMLSIPAPDRIESYDISNISGTDMVGGMVVFCGGKPHRSEYKKFKIEDMHQQDDYACMAQVLRRRFKHYQQQDKGFEKLPDLLLMDGGVSHANVAVQILKEFDLSIPVFGMVKDDRHRTRSLVTHIGQEIRIDAQQSIFALIGNIQEETHRFAIGYHRKLRSKRLQYSQLDSIPGIGPKRKQDLLKQFKSIQAIGAASLAELERYLPRNAAMAVYVHFHKEEI